MLATLLCDQFDLIIADAPPGHKRCMLINLRICDVNVVYFLFFPVAISPASCAAGAPCLSAAMLVPVPRSRIINTSAMMLTAISSGVSA
jgi:hypothetical protein